VIMCWPPEDALISAPTRDPRSTVREMTLS